MKIGNFPRPVCEQPILLVNRNAVKLIMSGWQLRIYHNNKDNSYNTYDVYNFHKCELHDFDFKGWLRIGYSFIYSNRVWDRVIKRKPLRETIPYLNRYIVTDGQGHYEFFYQLVGCGKCDLCHEKKINDFSNRCKYESQTSTTRPLFVTLTYDNYTIPRWVDEKGKTRSRGIPIADEYDAWRKSIPRALTKADMLTPIYQEMQAQRGLCQLSVDDVQRFMKRLRINWHRSTGRYTSDDDNPLRFVLVGEKGSISQHPHYHLILWNVPYNVDNNTPSGQYLLSVVLNDITKSWGFGRVDCQIAIDCARYVSKYVNKSDPNGNKGFRTTSSRHGGIGAKYLDGLRDYYQKNPTMQNIVGRDKWNGTPINDTMGAYATNRLFPPLRHYTSKFDYEHIYQTLQTRFDYVLKDYKKAGAIDHRNSMIPYFNDVLSSSRITNYPYFTPQSSFDYLTPFHICNQGMLSFELDPFKRLSKKLPYWVKSKRVDIKGVMTPLIVQETTENLILMLSDSYAKLHSLYPDIDTLLANRDIHKHFIPIKAVSDDYVKLKSIELQAKLQTRRSKERF